MTLVFVLLILGSTGAPQEVAVFDTREACSTFATTNHNEGDWRCVPVPIRNDDTDALE